MKSKNKFIIAIFASVVGVFTSCDTLDVKPTSLITNASFWSSPDDASGALTGMYVKLRSQAALNLFIWGEARSEVMEWGAVSGTLDYDKFYLNTLNATSAGPNWLGLYAAVNAANLVIKYVPGITFPNEAQKNDILAQAHTTRAFLYFVLTRTWGAVPLRTEPTEGYNAETTQKGRASQQEVFQLIKADLDKAISMYPTNNFPAGRNRWSLPAAYALKADVYLWTGKRLGGGNADLNVVIDACNKVAEADVQLLPNFADIFKYTNKGNKEILMAVGFKEVEAPNNYFFNMYAGQVASSTDPVTGEVIGLPAGGMVWTVTQLVRDQFSVDDTRRDASFIERTNYPSLIVKGRGVLVNGVRNYTSDIILYRYADVLLMKAEAKNALGQDPSAEMNLIRQRAYGAAFPSYEFVSGSQAANDEAILKERLLELVFEGKRWWDLVRFGKAFELVPSLADRAGDDYLLLFPISQGTLSLEPQIQQNDGY
jgi:hypothetical protein